MAWTQDDLDALDNAIKKGVRRVAYQNGSVEYHSLDEMLKLRDVMRSEIEGTGAAANSRASYVVHDRR